MKILKTLLDLPKDTMLDARQPIGTFRNRGAVTGFTVGDLMDEVHEYAERAAQYAQCGPDIRREWLMADLKASAFGGPRIAQISNFPLERLGESVGGESYGGTD